MIGIRCPYCGTANTEAAARDARSFVCVGCGKAVEPPLTRQPAAPPQAPPVADRRWSDGPPEESANRWSDVAPLGEEDSSPSVSVSQTSILPPGEPQAQPPPLVRPARSPLIWLLIILVLFLAALIGVVVLARNVKPWLEARQAAAQRASLDYQLRRLDNGTDAQRQEAAQAIVAMGPHAVVQTLERISQDPGGDKRFLFVTAAVDALAAAGSDATPGLREGLGSHEPRVRAAAANIIQEMGSAGRAACAELVAALDDGNRWVRYYAIDALASLGSAAAPAAKRLAELAATPDAFARRHAITALGRIGPEALGVLPALDAIAEKDVDLTIRDCAKLAVEQVNVEKLAHQARRDAKAPLKQQIKALLGDDAPAAIAAAQKLGEMGFAAQPAAVGLAAMLHNPDPARRAAAATALGKLGLGASDFVPTLQSAAADDDANVRAAAAKALDLINDKPK